MKKILLLLSLLFVFSCSDESETEEKKDSKTRTQDLSGNTQTSGEKASSDELSEETSMDALEDASQMDTFEKSDGDESMYEDPLFEDKQVFFMEDAQIISSKFERKEDYSLVSKDGFVYVISGKDVDSEGNSRDNINEVWKTKDYNEWIKLTGNAEFPKRAMTAPFIKDGHIHIVGGLKELSILPLEDSEFSVKDKDLLSDVWKSKDGKTWEKITEDGGFSGRMGHTSEVKDGYVYIIGGVSANTTFLNDVWKSKDGKTWEKITEDGGFPKRILPASFVSDGYIYILGGLSSEGDILDDLWRSRDGKVWEELADILE